MRTNEVTNKLSLLKDILGNLLYPKVLGKSIPDGSVTKAQLDAEVKTILDGIVITLNYSDHPGEYEVGESSLNSSSDLETYYNAYNQGVNIYFVINSVGYGHGFNTSSTNYLPVYEFGYDSRSGYTLKAKDDIFIYTANSIDESPYLTVTTSAITTEPKDFSVTTDKILNRAVTKEKLSKDVLEDITSITWHELKQLRDGNNLLPGHLYRITDYLCTTTQLDTLSTEHQFDIIVTADDINKLNEKARACLHNGDTYFKDSNLAAWLLWYCLDNDTKRFAWARANDKKYRLIYSADTVKPGVVIEKGYTIYGDGTKVTYDNKNYYSFSYLKASDSNKKIFIPTEIPRVGDTALFMIKDSSGNYTKDEIPNGDLWDPGTFNHITILKIEEDEFGHGVIYRMIDEYNNDCPYDFKNIQFKRYKITKSKSSSLVGTYLATETISDIGLEIDNNDSKMFYTFSYLGELDTQSAYTGEVLEDASIIGNTLQADNSSPFGVHGNTIKYYFDVSIENSKPILSLNNIVFLSYSIHDTYYGCYSNSFNVNCFNISFGNDCYDNSFGNDCYNNSFGNDCYNNSFGNNCIYISFNYICSNISFGNECNYITLGNHYRLNTFDNGVSYVTFNGNGTDSRYIQNYHIKQSMVFDRNSEYTITAKPGLNYELSVAKRSDGTVVEYNEADTHKLVSITNLDYAALTTKDSNTLYCILEE